MRINKNRVTSNGYHQKQPRVLISRTELSYCQSCHVLLFLSEKWFKDYTILYHIFFNVDLNLKQTSLFSVRFVCRRNVQSRGKGKIRNIYNMSSVSLIIRKSSFGKRRSPNKVHLIIYIVNQKLVDIFCKKGSFVFYRFYKILECF